MRYSLFRDVMQRRRVVADFSGQIIILLELLALEDWIHRMSETSVTNCQSTLCNISEERETISIITIIKRVSLIAKITNLCSPRTDVHIIWLYVFTGHWVTKSAYNRFCFTTFILVLPPYCIQQPGNISITACRAVYSES